MIANDEQLQLVQEQVATLESALESLEKTVRPRSEMQYRVFAEGYVDQLAILRADIDAYLQTQRLHNRAATALDMLERKRASDEIRAKKAGQV